MGAEILHEDGRTDGRTNTTMLVVTFRYFANVLKDLKLILKIIIALSLYLIVSSILSCLYVHSSVLCDHCMKKLDRLRSDDGNFYCSLPHKCLNVIIGYLFLRAKE